MIEGLANQWSRSLAIPIHPKQSPAALKIDSRKTIKSAVVGACRGFLMVLLFSIICQDDIKLSSASFAQNFSSVVGAAELSLLLRKILILTPLALVSVACWELYLTICTPRQNRLISGVFKSLFSQFYFFSF
jgi:hypothetical protein